MIGGIAMQKRLSLCVYVNAVLLGLFSFYIFLAPAAIVVRGLGDAGLGSEQTPDFVLDWHRELSGRYENWARKRVSRGQATADISDVPGTEWPLFGSVFYLWSTEVIHEDLARKTTQWRRLPRVYARGAIQAAAALLVDPGHAAWVKEHWGPTYLDQENLFYRMLLISGLTSYQKLSGDTQYTDLLSGQVESLALEIDRSPYGLLDDYPGKCYSVDVLLAIAAIRRADTVLGTDHSEFAARGLRAFEGGFLDSGTSLPSYVADSAIGGGVGPARGVGISMMLTWAIELWPETAEKWYDLYEEHFWRENRFFSGFAEFPRDAETNPLLFDADSGPVIAGYGTAASAFGIAAARSCGRFTHAYPLTAEALALSWPLPDGTLLGPRILSNLSGAPYLGEMAMLFSLTRKPLAAGHILTKGPLPWIVFVAIGLYVLLGLRYGIAAVLSARKWHNNTIVFRGRHPNLQFCMWAILTVGGVVCLCYFNAIIGVVLMLFAQLLPRRGKRPKLTISNINIPEPETPEPGRFQMSWRE